MDKKQKQAMLSAFLAAVLYALNAPVSKLLLSRVSPTMMAAFLYLGAGAGLFLIGLLQRLFKKADKEEPPSKKELPYVAGMIILDVLAPIFLMLGLEFTTAANASLLNNFEIAATSVTAFVIFKEEISKRLWAAIALVTLASVILSFEGAGSLSFSGGSLLVLLACVCWGFENNCTRKLSSKDPKAIVVIKGFGSGAGSLLVALILGEKFPAVFFAVCAMLLGFVAYGLSIYFYVYAQRYLGAAKTSTYYAVAPFVGAALSLVIFKELPGFAFITALVIMIAGTYLAGTPQKR